MIEDAAHAFPAKLDAISVGSKSDAACFSFYANKTITTGEGGMLITRSETIAKRSRIMRLHGIVMFLIGLRRIIAHGIMI